MSRCPEHHRIQDHLDGLLAAGEAEALRRHLDACDGCRAELVAFRRLFVSLERMPLERPTLMMTERVLSAVLPSRVRRRRWVARLSVGYAGALAACLVGATVWLSQPSPRELVEALAGEASRRIVHSMMFGLNVLGAAVLGLANGWGLVSYVGDRLAPLTRAMSTLLSHSTVEISLALAAVSCLALLAWLRTREDSEGRVPHVGLLGF